MTENTGVWYVKNGDHQRMRFIGERLYRAYYHVNPEDYRHWVCLAVYRITPQVDVTRLRFKGRSNAEREMLDEALTQCGLYVLSAKDRRIGDDERFMTIRPEYFLPACVDFFKPYVGLSEKFSVLTCPERLIEKTGLAAA